MMKMKLIYPTWPKLERQTTFHLPPHGPVVFAATVPDDVEIIFEDDNVQDVNFDEDVDLVAISTMLPTVYVSQRTGQYLRQQPPF